MAKRKTSQLPERPSDRARAATERARARLAARDGTPVPHVDITRVPLSWWRERWADKAIRRQFIENFIYIRDAFEQKTLSLLKFNDLQSDLHERMAGRDVMVKFRRAGSSTFWLAIKFSNALVMSGRTVRLVPHDPDTADEFLDALNIMYANLPDHLRVETEQESAKVLSFNDAARGTVDSRIKTSTVQPGHEAKGRGQAITDLLLTEVPHWRGDGRKAATALIEAAVGGEVTIESTPYGVEWFHSIYTAAKQGRNEYTPHFYEWWWMRHYRRVGARVRRVGKDYFLSHPDEPRAERYKHPVTSVERKICARISRTSSSAATSSKALNGLTRRSLLISPGGARRSRRSAKRHSSSNIPKTIRTVLRTRVAPSFRRST